MSKHIEKLKKQLLEISEVVNSFRSEAVQVKVVDRLLDAMIESEKGELDGADAFNRRVRRNRQAEDDDNHSINGRKKPGATKVLNQLLLTDFFNSSHSISEIEWLELKKSVSSNWFSTLVAPGFLRPLIE